METFDFTLNVVNGSQESILATVAGIMAPIFKPLGFDDWRICTALISGFMAKESVVSTISVLFGTVAINTVLNKLSALSLLIFCLLYTPCVAAIASIKRELGTRWALGVVLFQCAVAWLCAFLVFSFGTLFI